MLEKSLFIFHDGTLTCKPNALLNNRVFSFSGLRCPSLGRSSSGAKRKMAQRQSEEGQAKDASTAFAAYRARTQSEDHSEQEKTSTSRESQSRWTQEKEAERNVAARIMRREDKEYSDHQRHQGHVARAAVRLNSGNRRVEQARDTPARRVQEQES
jgi:hypothetical protein